MNILLSFAANKTYLVQFFKQAVGNTGKVYVCDNEFNYAFTNADNYFVTPSAYDESYVSVLTDYCIKNDISVIIPLSDIDLHVLAENKSKLLESGIFVVVSDEQIIDVCFDKWKTHQFLESVGIKHPKSYIDLKEVKQDINTGKLSFPIVLKPRFSSEKTKIIEVCTIEELDMFYYKMQQNILSISDIKENDNILMYEDLSGDHYGLCLLNDLKGNFITAAALKKNNWSETCTMSACTVDVTPFDSIIKSISSELKHIACLEIDCCITNSGDIVLSRLYARFGHSYPLWHLAGANFPKQILNWLNGLSTSNENISFEIGITSAEGSCYKIIEKF